MTDAGTPEPGQSNHWADQAERYRLDSRIATGGMGVVWRATDTRLHREVAVKVLKEEYADDATFRSRFDTEARNAAALHHPNIAGVFDYDADPTDGRAPFLVMELVDGKPLSALLSDARAEGRRLDAGVVRDLMGQASDGLAAAHAAGIVHRDVKPANLVVTAKGVVKVTDFGIARAADAAAITRTGAVMGTPQYLSPEQAEGKPATAASDVYSLGVVTWEALAGARPFEADSPVATVLAHVREPVPELPSHVPADLAVVVRRALAKDPAERYADGRALAAALRDPASAAAAAPPATTVLPATAATAMDPVEPVERLTPPTSYDGDAAPPQRKGPAWPIVAVVVLLVAAIALIFWLLLQGGVFGGSATDEQSSAPPSATTDTTEETTEPTEPTETGPALVQLDPADYVGRDVAEVESDLHQMDFEVKVSEVDNDGSHDEGTVARIDPHGSVEEGALITIHYYGPAPTETETPTEEPSEEPTETPTSDGLDILPEGETP